jgi:MFS family permease
LQTHGATEETTQKRSFRLLRVPPTFRYPTYRNYWTGLLASVSGFQVFLVAQIWLVHELTGSALDLGYVGLANGVPAIILNLVGGVVADRFDRRKLIMVTQAVGGLLILALATLVLLDYVRLWHIIAIAVGTGSVNAFDQPARQSLFPRLVGREAMTSAVAMNGVVWQGTRIAAPAAGGVIIATMGTASALYVAGGGFWLMGLILFFIHIPHVSREPDKSPLHEMVEGLQFIRHNTVFTFLLGMIFFNSFFGMAFIWLMPIFAEEILSVGAQGVGFMLSVSGVGGLVITLVMSSMHTVRYHGDLIIGGGILAGLSIATFGITTNLLESYTLAIALMFVVGFATTAYTIAVIGALQFLVPDRLRGRVMGFFTMTWNIMPLGAIQAGSLANVWGAPAAVAIGGFAVATFAPGPVLLNKNIRKLGVRLEEAAASAEA